MMVPICFGALFKGLVLTFKEALYLPGLEGLLWETGSLGFPKEENSSTFMEGKGGEGAFH